MNVTFDHREPIAKNIVTLWFKPERPVFYVAGQFTEMYLPHAGVDSRGERRWFTLSSSPTDPLLGITTRLAAEDSSSFKKALDLLQPGAPLKLADPMGDFVLPKDTSLPLLFVAAGLGITPVHSMVKWMRDRREERPVHLIYAVSHENELAFLPLFEEFSAKFGMQFTPVVKHPSAGWQGESGSLTTSRILELAGSAFTNSAADENALIYLSGPEPMTETFYKELTARGVPNERLVTDYFPGYIQF
ncbi:MAG TPA: FAD-dependent oxidoreductase [Candidatus Saccharimonadales bacterium]|nr:FAD-dependent oxidoreductase [Candidatus Saccharimonadales bacterium]